MRGTGGGVPEVEMQKELQAGCLVPRSQVARYQGPLMPSVGGWWHGWLFFPFHFFFQTFFIFNTRLPIDTTRDDGFLSSHSIKEQTMAWQG